MTPPPLVFFSPRSAGDDVDLEDYVNRPEKISAADVAAIAQVSTKNRREKAIKETILGDMEACGPGFSPK